MMNLVLTAPADRLSRYAALMERGAHFAGRVGVSVREFLTKDLGLDPEYVEDRVRTVFLNGLPVDDLDREILAHGDRLALAAAMPGAFGMIFRRASPIALMRKDFSRKDQKRTAQKGQGRVRVLLYNLVRDEVGPDLLARGMIVKAARLGEFLAQAWQDDKDPGALTLDNRPAAPDQVLSALARANDRDVNFRVVAQD